MASPPSIRPLTPADAHAYIAIRREMLADSPWAFASSLEDDPSLDPAVAAVRTGDGGPGQAIIGAFDDGQLIGTAGLYCGHHIKMAHRAHIWGVYISPAHRGRGIGTPLMTAAIDTARAWPGITSIALSCSEQSTAALRLYQRLGFQQWGREPAALVLNGRSYDEIHMVLQFEEPADR
jgi:RimJ/RimL family protein N-acetyltransferase